MPLAIFQRTTLQLSMLALWACTAAVHAENVNIESDTPHNTSYNSTISPTPSTPQACAALESNAERLNCYDLLFQHPEQPQVLVSERQAAKEIAKDIAAPTESHGVKDNVRQVIGSLFAVEGPAFDNTTSLLDSRWELSPDSKLGTWNLRSYQPVYLLPLFWTSSKNTTPYSPNPDNRVPVEDAQILDSMESKFQLSLKTKALENIFGDNGDLWLGYTQSSRWQVYNSEDSRPFRETNYEPEASLMFRTNYEVLGLNGRLLGLSLNHQSNGRADPLSRSWNRVMLNIGLERENFAIMFRPWYRVEEKAKDDNNPDIKNYIGRGDVTAFYRWNEHDFSLMLRHSLRTGSRSHGAAQFDWSFPISGRLRGHLQLFDGYGESMIDYNHRAFYAGLGVSLMNWF
ncbi:phospholipase A [Acinetobacter larvae]|uniref:Phospholipase A1 n=1 Tax=Acinetobacter larvae TaxID=1789224 RepID=A0A1B2M0L7_9GAMM|nr:phospholipase A [Acinetobacter larvae]AOA58737.1 phospholipase [Acinetobacter larvae]